MPDKRESLRRSQRRWQSMQLICIGYSSYNEVLPCFSVPALYPIGSDLALISITGRRARFDDGHGIERRLAIKLNFQPTGGLPLVALPGSLKFVVIRRIWSCCICAATGKG